jgi:ABC-type Fe3+-hydroxamate transport system substrate-binding protein
MMREVKFERIPSRIISLVPSITELLAALGLENEIAGITKFCVHPENIFRSKTRVGGTKKIDHSKIDLINPDLVVASKEENTREDIEILESKYPVWVSDVKNLDDALTMIYELGRITGKGDVAVEICKKITSNFQTILPLNKIKTLYLIWKNPFMAAGGDTFINEMMRFNGMQNVLQNQNRYPELTLEEITELSPELILLSSEPYPFKEKDLEEIKPALPGSIISLVDGEYFSWYGSRLIDSPAYFNTLTGGISKIKTAEF